MAKQSQNVRLLAHLKKSRKINPLEAWQQLGIYRLGARIFDLKKGGHKIKVRRVSVKNRYGEACRVAEYYL